MSLTSVKIDTTPCNHWMLESFSPEKLEESPKVYRRITQTSALKPTALCHRHRAKDGCSSAPIVCQVLFGNTAMPTVRYIVCGCFPSSCYQDPMAKNLPSPVPNKKSVLTADADPMSGGRAAHAQSQWAEWCSPWSLGLGLNLEPFRVLLQCSWTDSVRVTSWSKSLSHTEQLREAAIWGW